MLVAAEQPERVCAVCGARDGQPTKHGVLRGVGFGGPSMHLQHSPDRLSPPFPLQPPPTLLPYLAIITSTLSLSLSLDVF